MNWNMVILCFIIVYVFIQRRLVAIENNELNIKLAQRETTISRLSNELSAVRAELDKLLR